MKRVFAIVLAAVLLGACGGGGDGGGDAAADLPPDYVLVKGSKFIPDKLTVKTGAEVTFEFSDGSLQHNAVADDKAPAKFDTGLHTEKQIKVKIEKPGVYNYTCTIHPTMEGTLTAE